MYTTFTTESRGETLLITINRPKVLNALNKAVFTELEQIIDAFVVDKIHKGAILTGSGEKAFAAGADISEFQSLDASMAETQSKRGQDIFFKIERSPKPIIAAVNGFALGGGCELAMSCHFRIASENARFGQPEVKLGLLPGYGGTQRLVDIIGRGRATELLITGKMISAEEALNYGLVNSVTPIEELIPTCEGILQQVYKQSAMAVRLTLEAIAEGIGGNDGYRAESVKFGEAISSGDGKEGAAAFLEKRKADFKEW